MVGYIPRLFTCEQAVTHPGSNWARYRVISLFEINVLTTTEYITSANEIRILTKKVLEYLQRHAREIRKGTV